MLFIVAAGFAKGGIPIFYTKLVTLYEAAIV